MASVEGKCVAEIMTSMSPEEEKAFDCVAELYGKLGEIRARIEKDVPSSRERSLVLTKLDEAVLWLGMAPLS